MTHDVTADGAEAPEATPQWAPDCPLPHPETLMKLLIIVCLIAIVVSLGSGLFHLVNDQGQSKRMVKALTVRIALSVALFILLLIAWWQGMIQPHGLGQ